MFPYIITISLVVGLLYAAEQSSEKMRNNIVVLFLIVLCVAVQVVFAGMRAPEIGTDTSLYGIPMFYNGKVLSFDEYGTVYPTFAPLFRIYCWSASRIIDNPSLFLMAIQIPTALCSTAAIWISGKRNRWVGMALYMLYFYPISFNLIRQSMAMSVLIFGLSLLISADDMKKGLFRALVFAAVATLCHSSAILGFAVVLAYLVFSFNKKTVAAFCLFVAVSLVFGLIAYPFLLNFLSNISHYFALYGDSGTTLFGTALLVSGSFTVVVVLMSSALVVDGQSESYRIYYLPFICLSGALLFCYSAHAIDLYRTALYLLSVVVLIPSQLPLFEIHQAHLIRGWKKNERGKLRLNELVILASIFIFVILFVIYFVVLRQHEVVPYVFSLVP